MAESNKPFPNSQAPRDGEAFVEPGEARKAWLDSLPIKARERALMAIKNGDTPVERAEWPEGFVAGARDKWGLIGWRANGSGAYLDGPLASKPAEAPPSPPVPSTPAPRLVGKPKAARGPEAAVEAPKATSEAPPPPM